MRAFFISNLVVFGFLTLMGCAQRVEELDTRLQDIDERTRILESKGGLPVGSDRELLEGRRLADVRTQVAAMRNDTTVMNGRLEALDFEVKALREELNEAQRTLNDLRSNNNSQAGAAKAARSGLSPSEQKYREALSLHQKGDFEGSRGLFLDFVKEFPKDSLADNAIFWMGESYFIEKSYRKALVRFQDLIEKFPESDKKCDAMDRQVSSFEALGMKEEAKAYADVRTQECRKEKRNQ